MGYNGAPGKKPLQDYQRLEGAGKDLSPPDDIDTSWSFEYWPSVITLLITSAVDLLIYLLVSEELRVTPMFEVAGLGIAVSIIQAIRTHFD